MRAALIGAILAAATVASVAGVAQDRQRFRGGGGFDQGGPPIEYQGNTPYDGRFVFVRLRYSFGSGFGGRRGGGPPWSHDYPRGEVHFTKILKEITYVNPRLDGSNVLALDDPELFNYPISLMWEPGFWNLTDGEAESFRAYLLKGGFTIFEDFDGPEQWNVFASQMRRVLPEGRFVELGPDQRIFDSFFRIKDINGILHPMYGLKPRYLGIYEDNDPSKRLMVVANFDNDVPEYWEWSGQGMFPFDTSNEAYKLGVNYVIYAVTH
jgi:hypothetical protein